MLSPPSLASRMHKQPDDLGRVGMQMQFAVSRIAARSLRDIRDMAEIVAVGALRAADAEMRADAPIDGLHPLGIVLIDRKAAHD